MPALLQLSISDFFFFSISESSDGCGNHHSSQMILREDTLNTVKYTYRVTWNVGYSI